MAAAKASDFALYRRVLTDVRPFWPHIGGIFLLSLLSTPLTLLSPLALKIVVDSVIGDEAVPGFMNPLLPGSVQDSDTALLVVAVALFWEIQGIASALLRSYTGEKLVLGFRSRLFRHAQRLSLTYHDSLGTADSIYRIRRDASSIRSLAINGLTPFITSGLTLVAMVYIVLRLDWQLGLVALVIMPVLFVLSGAYRNRVRRQSEEVKAIESSALGVVQESLGALRVVRAFGREEQEEERFVQSFAEGVSARLRLIVTESSLDGFINMTTVIGTAIVLFIGVREVQSGSLSIGDLLVVLTYLAEIYSPLSRISRRMVSLQNGLVGAARAYALIDQEPDVVQQPNALPLRRSSGKIAFRNVSFGYDDGEPVLQDISFEVKAVGRQR